MLYRIWTENKNAEQIAEIVGAKFNGFSMFSALGYWRGIPEKSLVIEIDAPLDDERVMTVACDIKEHNNQAAVLVQELPIESTLL